jgi:hypothetical protein
MLHSYRVGFREQSNAQEQRRVEKQVDWYLQGGSAVSTRKYEVGSEQDASPQGFGAKFLRVIRILLIRSTCRSIFDLYGVLSISVKSCLIIFVIGEKERLRIMRKIFYWSMRMLVHTSGRADAIISVNTEYSCPYQAPRKMRQAAHVNYP